LVASLGEGALPRRVAADVAASFQAAVADILQDRTTNALNMFPEASALIVAGGVAANAPLRARLMGVAAQAGKKFIAPPLRLCTDNAVMVAWAGIERLKLGMVSGLDAPCRPRWPL
jgi:N6-L-threonylcarbamoyladenine synthase